MLDVGGRHDRRCLVDPVFQRQQLVQRIGDARPGLVVHDESTELGDAFEKLADERGTEDQVEVGDERRHEQDVRRAVAEHLEPDLAPHVFGVLHAVPASVRSDATRGLLATTSVVVVGDGDRRHAGCSVTVVASDAREEMSSLA
jgi:hypothetical protein